MCWCFCWLFFLSFVYIHCNSENEVTATCNQVEGYYWRDFSGEIPDDALEGGIDITGEKTYIGQTYHNGLLIPGKISKSQKKLYYEWGRQEYAATDNVKILCTSQPHKLEWISTSGKNFRNLGDRNYIIGGYEPQNKIYVGRIYAGGELSLGKLQVQNSDLNAVLHTTTRDHKGTEHYQFDVLVYNNKPSITSDSNTFTNKNKVLGASPCKKVTINFYADNNE